MTANEIKEALESGKTLKLNCYDEGYHLVYKDRRKSFDYETMRMLDYQDGYTERISDSVRK